MFMMSFNINFVFGYACMLYMWMLYDYLDFSGFFWNRFGFFW